MDPGLNARPQSERAFRSAVATLTAADPALSAQVEQWGDPPFWHRSPGFATLVLLILEQQVSLASAAAAFARLEDRIGPIGPEPLLDLDDRDMLGVGFSRQKTRYARALASAVIDGSLDLEALSNARDDMVRRSLMRLPGIGRWTADVYLLSCLRRADIWPIGDRALQVSTTEVLGLDDVPDPDGLEEIGTRWAPNRSTAARIMWHAYLSRRGR